MAKTLSQIGVETNYLVRAWHVSQSIDALTGADDYDITVSGSLTVTGSVYVNGLSTTPTTNVLTYDPTTGEVKHSASIDINVGNALTASYVDLVAGDNIIINQVGTSFEISGSANFIPVSVFNAFTGSYNTGSFTGSFTGSLLGTASYVNLAAGPGITINQAGITFEISGSGTANTSSLLITASAVSTGIEFTKGDASTFIINLPQNLTNIYTDWDSPQYYTIPGGNYRVIVSGSTSPSTDKILFLPTESYSVGDIIEITGNGDLAPYNLYLSQSLAEQQIIDSYYSTTPGITGYVQFFHRDTIRLTCVNSSSIDGITWIVSNYYGFSSSYS